MSSKKAEKLVSEKVFPQAVGDENAKALELYKETDDILKETFDILEKIDIALGRKQVYKYTFGSTKNFKINPHAIPPTTKNFKINPHAIPPTTDSYKV